MSVHQESLEISKPADRMEEAPELEYRAVSHDSLSMFLAAIGGAILGVLLTLLILALINGGTLSFSGGERLSVIEATLERVNDNVGSVSTNVDLVSQQSQDLANQFGTVEASLRAKLSEQDSDIATLDSAMAQLDVTRQQFDVFMGALGQAMSEVQKVEKPAARSAIAPAAAEPAPTAAPLPAPSVSSSADVAPDAVAVLLFVDANANGTFDKGETAVVGAAVALEDADGKAIASAKSTADGVLFSDLSAGQYKVSVEDAAGYELLTTREAPVTVAENAKEGQSVNVAVASK